MSDNAHEQQWPQPDNPTEPITPPSGFVESPQVQAPEPVDWQDRYAKERRRTQIFMGTTALAGALLVGALFYASAQGGTADMFAGRGSGPALGQGPGGQGPGGQGLGNGDDHDLDRGMGEPGMGGPGMAGPGAGGRMEGGTAAGAAMVQQFFTSDGSLNEDAVAAFKQRLEAMSQWDQDGDQISFMKSRMSSAVQQAVEDDTITQQQADELTKALDLPAPGASGADGGSDSAT